MRALCVWVYVWLCAEVFACLWSVVEVLACGLMCKCTSFRLQTCANSLGLVMFDTPAPCLTEDCLLEWVSLFQGLSVSAQRSQP